ncbi:MAG: hypothetical protein HS126_10460 [Anaerolineales bacterium]|nr:hypothetical protein [Anaerolineales bacterium]
MATPFTETLDQITAQFQATFTHIAILRREERPQVAILEMRGDYGIYQVYLREIWRANGSRKYAYYVLNQSKIVAGFDNASDPRALRLKYGKDFVHHRFELIPHRHNEDKSAIELTQEMDCAAFITWLKNNLPYPSESGE